VFIADTSLFPTASGVNPMLTVMALAQYVGLNIQNRLERIKFIEEGLQKKGLYLYDDCPKTTD
jgi:choline dehydrogenase-like flavoprotein